MTGLYTHIYQQAWQTLDEEARRILLAMPLVNPEGGDIDLLAAITAISLTSWAWATV